MTDDYDITQILSQPSPVVQNVIENSVGAHLLVEQAKAIVGSAKGDHKVLRKKMDKLHTHVQGACRACFFAGGNCMNPDACTYCHFCSDERRKSQASRLGKRVKAMARIRQQLATERGIPQELANNILVEDSDLPFDVQWCPVILDADQAGYVDLMSVSAGQSFLASLFGSTVLDSMPMGPEQGGEQPC